MAQNELNWGQRAALESLWWSARLFAVMPYWFKYYVVQNVIFFVLYYCARYRINVVNRNLRNSFPEKSEKELAAIRRGFYLMLAEIFVDTVNMSHWGQRKGLRMVLTKDIEKQRDVVCDRDWIAMAAHYGCWEYCTQWGLFEPSHMTIAVYHPLENIVMEHFYRRLRSSETSTAVGMHDSVRFYLRNREKGVEGKRMVIGLIADQNPPRRPDSHWFRFLNQDTLFFDGGEKLALRFHLPVFFVKQERVGRGRYRLGFEQIYDGVEPVAENEITERYVEKLDAMIREHPELWLWSHRRWKHKRKHVNG